MSLQWVEFKNNDINLSIDRVNFNKNISLLVGLSGSGKSQIISAIEILCEIATNSTESFQSISGSLAFSVNNNDYVWSVSTAHIENDLDGDTHSESTIFNRLHMMYYDAKTIIVSEQLTCNGNVIFRRNEKENYIMGFKEIPPSDSTRSFFSLFRMESQLREAFVYLCGIRKIWFIRGAANKLNSSSFYSRVERFSHLNEINGDRQLYTSAFPANEFLITKIEILKRTNPKMWQEIFQNYIAIFPEVSDILICSCYGSGDAVTIYYKIENEMVDIGNISSGMIKTLQLIVDTFVASSNNVIMIDEIENGFGINCIDEIWTIIKKQSKRTQYILTSHHPYVISNLHYKDLLIVQRDGNIISTSTGEDFKLGDTHRDYYDVIFNKLQFGEC